MKWVHMFCLAFALSLVLALPALAQPAVMLDGRPLTFDVPPQTVSGRTLVPLRVIFESLGATVVWDAATQTVTATRGERGISLTIGKRVAYVNGASVTLDVPGRTIKGRTMVPLRFVGEGMGANVVWDGATKRIVITSGAGTPPAVAPVTTREVTRVIDGDTIEVDFQGKLEKVRLIGVDTPEVSGQAEPFGKEASNFTRTSLAGKHVRLEFDVQERDRFGRLLAYVWLGNSMFNEQLLREGFAQVATFPPNVKYVERFTQAQREARESKRGLWGLATAPTPVPIPGRVNINTASLEDLLKIKHIGEERAREIIRLRPFKSVDDLGRVTGIGPSRLADIKAQGIAYVP